MEIVTFDGKPSAQIAREYGVTVGRVNQYAKEDGNGVKGYSFDGVNVELYIFNEAAEEKFVNRQKVSPGRPATDPPPKIPGKPGRPRKEKPVNTGPKNPVGRPSKYPKEAITAIPKLQVRGRPQKK
jgi:hypothetical protein